MKEFTNTNSVLGSMVGKVGSFDNIIYCVINNIDSKRYIGATTKSLKERKQDHLERASRGQDNKLYEALRVHGSGAFI